MRIRLILAVCALFAVTGAATCLHGFSAPETGGKAPDFSLKDLKGAAVKLSDLRGKVVLLSFSATWCPHCRTAVPKLKEIAARYKDKEFVLLSIFIQESGKKVSSFAAKYDIAYSILLDEDGAIAKAYGVRGIPSKTIVGKDGMIVCRDCREAEPELEKLLGAAGK